MFKKFIRCTRKVLLQGKKNCVNISKINKIQLKPPKLLFLLRNTSFNYDLNLRSRWNMPSWEIWRKKTGCSCCYTTSYPSCGGERPFRRLRAALCFLPPFIYVSRKTRRTAAELHPCDSSFCRNLWDCISKCGCRNVEILNKITVFFLIQFIFFEKKKPRQWTFMPRVPSMWRN